MTNQIILNTTKGNAIVIGYCAGPFQSPTDSQGNLYTKLANDTGEPDSTLYYTLAIPGGSVTITSPYPNFFAIEVSGINLAAGGGLSHNESSFGATITNPFKYSGPGQVCAFIVLSNQNTPRTTFSITPGSNLSFLDVGFGIYWIGDDLRDAPITNYSVIVDNSTGNGWSMAMGFLFENLPAIQVALPLPVVALPLCHQKCDSYNRFPFCQKEC